MLKSPLPSVLKLKLVYGQNGMHCTLYFCPDQTSQERIKCTKAKEQPHFTQAHAQNQNKHYKHMFTNQNKHFSNLLHTFLLSDLYTVVAPLKEDAFV